jgi:hypothetical protein
MLIVYSKITQTFCIFQSNTPSRLAEALRGSSRIREGPQFESRHDPHLFLLRSLVIFLRPFHIPETEPSCGIAKRKSPLAKHARWVNICI